MEKKELIYEGKAKKIFATEKSDLLIAEFKDDLTAFNNIKKGNEVGKGALNNKISTELFKILEKKGVQTHLVETIDETHQLVKKVEIIPLEVIVRNIATGSFVKRFGVEDGKVLPFALVELCLKDDTLGDPPMCADHALALEIATQEELSILKEMALTINSALQPFFAKVGLNLVDFKIEFGRDSHGTILLADEISPDSCRFWDLATNAKMDKDIFRQGLGDVKVAYEEVLNRILGAEK